jgi:hypothetical protein
MSAPQVCARAVHSFAKMNRRAFPLTFALALSPLLVPLHARDARATVAALVTLDDLVGGSTSR